MFFYNLQKSNCSFLKFFYSFSWSCPRNMFIPFKFITVASSCSLYPLILISRSIILVTSPFFVLSVLKTSNEKFIGFVYILLSLTSYLLISVYMYLKSTSALSLRFLPFFVFMFACMFDFFLNQQFITQSSMQTMVATL